MISHGYTPTVLLKSTIVSIPKDNKVSPSNSLFYIYIKINFNHLICNLDIKKDTLQRCVLWFIKKLFLIMLTIIQVYIVACKMHLRHLIEFTWVNYLAYCYIKISPQQSLDYILTVIPDKRLVLVGTILCLNISLCQTE